MKQLSNKRKWKKSCSVHSSITWFSVFAHFVSYNKYFFYFVYVSLFFCAFSKSIRKWVLLQQPKTRWDVHCAEGAFFIIILHSAFYCSALIQKSFVHFIYSMFAPLPFRSTLWILISIYMRITYSVLTAHPHPHYTPTRNSYCWDLLCERCTDTQIHIVTPAFFLSNLW